MQDVTIRWCGTDPMADPRSVSSAIYGILQEAPDFAERLVAENAVLVVVGIDGWSHGPRGGDDARLERKMAHAFEAARRDLGPPTPDRPQLWIGATRKGAAEAAARLGPALLPGVHYLGAVGSYEGGQDFHGADGTFIRSADWPAARDYVRRLGDRLFGASATPG